MKCDKCKELFRLNEDFRDHLPCVTPEELLRGRVRELEAELEAAQARCTDLVDECDVLRQRVEFLERPDCYNCGGQGEFFNGSNYYSCNECGGAGKVRSRG